MLGVVGYEDFQALFTNFCSSINISVTIDWNTWIQGTGMPPVPAKYSYMSTALTEATTLAEDFILLGGYALP